jgi:hypothetical protein
MGQSSDHVFFSRVDAADWEHDEETGGLGHMLRHDDLSKRASGSPSRFLARLSPSCRSSWLRMRPFLFLKGLASSRSTAGLRSS